MRRIEGATTTNVTLLTSDHAKFQLIDPLKVCVFKNVLRSYAQNHKYMHYKRDKEERKRKRV